MPSKYSKDGEQSVDRDRDGDTPKSRDKERRRSSRSSRKHSSKDRENDPIIYIERSSTSGSKSSKRRSSKPLYETEPLPSSTSPRRSSENLPYPSFSKEHSKEAVGSRESVVNPRLSLYTPNATDLDWRKGGRNPVDGILEEGNYGVTEAAPPSPPLTDVEPDMRKNRSSEALNRPKAPPVEIGGRRSMDDGAKVETQPQSPRRSRTSPWSFKNGDSVVSSRSRKSKQSTRLSLNGSKQATVEDAESFVESIQASSTTASSETVTESASTVDSDATSKARNHHTNEQVPSIISNLDSSPASCSDSSPQTPRQGTPFLPSIDPNRKETPAVVIDVGPRETPSFGLFSPGPPPPPPPPPPMMPMDIPRVDYLLQSGGLPRQIPKALLAAKQQASTQQYQQYASPQVRANPTQEIEELFAPYNSLLNDYSSVLTKNGSIAVATGYKSVARRLLDRLETVFARDISSETCCCSMCQASPPIPCPGEEEEEEERGINWGEVLELVSGRGELPSWPAFSLASEVQGLGITPTERRTPMQSLDVDVPEEFRDHFIRQCKKTQQFVDRWLASQPEVASSPPQEVDDETLTFAILTHLEPHQRPIFSVLMGSSPGRPGSRAPTPLQKPSPEWLTKTGLSIQRLYRLPSLPRNPESAIYMLNNPNLHNVLATVSAISQAEWEVLTSGRFDGFLWSGAESTTQVPSAWASPTMSRGPSRGPTPLSRNTTPFNTGLASRGTTPFSPAFGASSRINTPFHNLAAAASRGATPAAHTLGAPVPLDEETEIAVLAEVEREIYLGMEALEDAFEALHRKAEDVRQALRQRGAGLSMAQQARLYGPGGGGANGVEVRLGTPASGIFGVGWESETDDGCRSGVDEDGKSELAPDDSASNISSNRHRRPKRRNERRTPAPVEEEDEGSIVEVVSRRG
ncbi:MAG: hypothetical protein M1827_003054 [Pycnora praestabilis]|nr:MAG: hypothetical protein M1827_003054 [Pycnora praestabilis]